jgi:putative transposase
MGVDAGKLLGRWKRKGGRKGERGLVMEMLYRYGGMNQREIGELMGLDYSAVSVGRKRFREAVEKNRRLGGLARRVETVLSQE